MTLIKKITVLLFFTISLLLLANEEIEMNLVGQFHYEYSSNIIGLAYDGENIWMADTSADSLIAIDKNTGEKLYGFPFPMDSNIYGLTFDGENFWASASQFYLYNISAEDGSIITSFHIPYPVASNARITELSWHNEVLYCMYTAGYSSAILGLDVETIACVDTIGTAECSSPTGLTYMNNHFWINDYVGIKIRKVNPEYGQYEGWFPHYNLCRGNVGITNDGEYMYCSDNYRNIYKYEIIENVGIEEHEINPAEIPIQITTYPNPFNPTTTIRFSIPVDNDTELTIYNIKGQKVKTLLNDSLTKGAHTVTWNGQNSNGESCTSGVYFLKLSTENDSYTKKLTILK